MVNTAPTNTFGIILLEGHFPFLPSSSETKLGVHIINFSGVGMYGLTYQGGNLGFLAQLLGSGEYVEESGIRTGPWRARNLLWEQRLTHPWFWLGGAWIHRVIPRGLSLRLTEGGRHLVECALRTSLG